MRIRLFGIALVCSALLLACTGDKGDQGDPGTDGDLGDQGDQGDPGPITDPPQLASISPEWGSAMTEVTITGQNFSTTPADNAVTFNGVAANVLSATATQLVVEPSVATDEPWPAVVSVEVANQVSNGLAFTVVPSGFARVMDVDLPTSPMSAVLLGSDLYLAAGGFFTPSSGLYKVDSDGWASAVWKPRAVEIGGGGGGPGVLYDSPVALATDGTDIYFTSVFGSVKRYDVSTGLVSDVLAAFGGDDCEFPGRTGLVFDNDGYLYVLDRNLDGCNGGILRLNTDGTVDAIENAMVFGDTMGATGLYDIATDGTDLFLGDALDEGVIRVQNPQVAIPTITDNYATGASGPKGIAIVGTDVVVSNDDGTLMGRAHGTTGALAVWGDAGGYTYQADTMWATASGDLYLAQSQSSAVRKIANTETDAEIVSAGMRIAFGTASIGDTWYLATIGFGLFSAGGPSASAAAPDGAIIEIAPGGASRVLATAAFPTGILATGATELTVSDCFGPEIYTLDVTDGTTDVRLDDDPGGLTCPAGLYLDGSGDLFYVNTDIGGGTPSTIGRLAADDTNTLAFATGLPPGMIFLAAIGDDLYVSGIGGGDGDGDGDGDGPGAMPIFTASRLASGTATELTPITAAGSLSALGASPNGSLYFMRFGFGEILEVNTTNGEVYSFGSSLAGPIMGGDGDGDGPMVGSFSMGFMADGSFVIADFSQGMVRVSP